ncbi:MAG: helix-turn-helix transcriptional regulator [Bacteroidia bacterium]|nr:helix-turn-helix transcriptional regulator [Bacteroidia bacterium]
MATNRLKEVLEKEGITQTQLALGSGISIGSINKWVNQKRNPSPTMQSRISKTINKILGDDLYQNDNIFKPIN